MTETRYAATAAFKEGFSGKRRVSVSGILDKLGVSRSGYLSWLKREPSSQQRRKKQIKEKIQEIHQESHRIYGAPKITEKLNDTGERIAEKTVGNYMRELDIKAHYVKPYTLTTKDSDFSEELKNILKSEFNQLEPNAVWCSDITYIWTFTGFISNQYNGFIFKKNHCMDAEPDIGNRTCNRNYKQGKKKQKNR